MKNYLRNTLGAMVLVTSGFLTSCTHDYKFAPIEHYKHAHKETPKPSTTKAQSTHLSKETEKKIDDLLNTLKSTEERVAELEKAQNNQNYENNNENYNLEQNNQRPRANIIINAQIGRSRFGYRSGPGYDPRQFNPMLSSRVYRNYVPTQATGTYMNNHRRISRF